MTNWRPALGLPLALALAATISSAVAQQLNPEQIQIIRDTAASICNTVKEAKGQKSDVQIQGDVKAQLGGLAGRLIDAGVSGKGSLNREEFEGLSRDATAAALEGDRVCRQQLFNKMFDKATSSDKKSEIPKAEAMIAGVTLGYDYEESFSKTSGKLDSIGWRSRLEKECSLDYPFRLDKDIPLNALSLCSCNMLLKEELTKINADAARLYIKPLRFDNSLTVEQCIKSSLIPTKSISDVYWYFRSNIKDQQIFESFEVGIEKRLC
jgi:hypothetical protein